MKLLNTVIDWPATRKKIEFLNISAWARSKGLCSKTIRRIVNEDYPHFGKKYLRALEELRNDGFLVEVEKQEAA